MFTAVISAKQHVPLRYNSLVQALLCCVTMCDIEKNEKGLEAIAQCVAFRRESKHS